MWEPGSGTKTGATTETIVRVALLAIAQGLFLSSVKNCVTLVLASYPLFSMPLSKWSTSGDRLSTRTESHEDIPRPSVKPCSGLRYRRQDGLIASALNCAMSP